MGARVQAVELFRVRMPLVRVFSTASSTLAAKEALLVRVETDEGLGWGECGAQEVPSYAPDTVDTARIALRDYLVPLAFAGLSFDAVRGHAAARAALECALLDASLRAAGISLAMHLGATRARVPAGVAIGLTGDDELAALVDEYRSLGYTRIKCKIAPGHDLAVARGARARAGDDLAVAVDANGSYPVSEAAVFSELDELGLQCIEQPFAPDALLEHATLAARLRTLVCLDETITSAGLARGAIALGAAGIVSIKPGRLGGLEEARRVHDVCVATGTPALVGGMLETGVGRAALIALAAMPGVTATGDCSASDRYFGPDGDLTEPFVLEAGALRVPEGPGLGVEVREDQLARYCVARERLVAGRS